MRVIDLLNKIANEEEVPKEIKYNACLFAFERQSQDYYCEEYGNLFEYLINEHRTGEFLNDEVEIIEEDIRKLPNEVREPHNFEEVVYIAEDLVNKINEIIEVLNERDIQRH